MNNNSSCGYCFKENTEITPTIQYIPWWKTPKDIKKYACKDCYKLFSITVDAAEIALRKFISDYAFDYYKPKQEGYLYEDKE